MHFFLNHFGFDVNDAMKQLPRLKLSCRPTSSSKLKYINSPVLFSGMLGSLRALQMISLVSQGWSCSGVSFVNLSGQSCSCHILMSPVIYYETKAWNLFVLCNKEGKK